MKISVKVSARSKQRGVVSPGADGEPYRIYVSESPIDGKANRAVIRALADYFSVAPSLITIEKGLTSRNKIVTIELL